MSLYVIDCGIWISALLYGGKFNRFRTGEEEAILELYLADAVWVEPEESISDCTDSDDNIYLECALAAKASAILSGDKHLLQMNPVARHIDFTVADFLEAQRIAMTQEKK